MLIDACYIACTWPIILTIFSDMQLELISSISLFKISWINVLHGDILKPLFWSVTDSVPFSETFMQPESIERWELTVESFKQMIVFEGDYKMTVSSMVSMSGI